jgi:serine/threonine protein kinase
VPGDTFLVGANTVTYTARDTSGNEAICTFSIDVGQPKTASARGLDSSTTSALGGGMAVLFIVIAVVFLVLLQRARRKVPADFQAILDELNLGATDDNGLRKPRELERETVQIVETIGQGNFGTVDKAMYTERRGPTFLVAVKRLHAQASSEARQEILEEAAIMAQFEHPCVVALVGVVTKGDPILAVLEYMEKGALLSYIRKHGAAISLKQRLQWCLDLADGLAYLHARRFVHRDVAARNVLLDSQLKAKISDFGMTREGNNNESEAYYKARKGGAVPVRWTAPEALEHARFSTATDVWAYGTTVGEIFTNGQMPYDGMTNQMVWVRVMDGYREPRSETCPEDVYNTCMLACWEKEADERPTMEQLKTSLQKQLLPAMTQDSDNTASATPPSTARNASNPYLLPQRPPLATYDNEDILKRGSTPADVDGNRGTQYEYSNPSLVTPVVGEAWHGADSYTDVSAAGDDFGFAAAEVDQNVDVYEEPVPSAEEDRYMDVEG